MSDNYDLFEGVLSKIYMSMGKTDLFQIYNLVMNESPQEMVVTSNELKPGHYHDFEAKFATLHTDLSRVKSTGSNKYGFKRMSYEKDFNRILQHID